MEFTHLVLILIDDAKKHIITKTTEFRVFDRFKYVDYSKDRSIIITCANVALAKNIKAGFDALLFDSLSSGLSYTAYNISSLQTIKELISLYDRNIKGMTVKTFDNIKFYENEKYDLIYHSLNFYKIFDEIIRQIDGVIDEGAYFDKVKKAGVKSIIYDRTLKILDEIKLEWAYNDGGNIVIDYSGLIKWKALGVYSPNRRIVELKYFY